MWPTGACVHGLHSSLMDDECSSPRCGEIEAERRLLVRAEMLAQQFGSGPMDPIGLELALALPDES